MKNTVLLLILLFAGNQIVTAQDKKAEKSPDEKVTVNREYDESGNLIRFDSTYVKSWSSDSTMVMPDMEAIQKEMESMFGENFHHFFGDSTSAGADPFKDMHKRFFEYHHEFMNGFDFDGDSMDWQGFFNPDDLDSIHERMFQRFGQFFGQDSTNFQPKGNPFPEDFDFFFSPEEMERLKKELEEQFDQPKPNEAKPEKMGLL